MQRDADAIYPDRPNSFQASSEFSSHLALSAAALASASNNCNAAALLRRQCRGDRRRRVGLRTVALTSLWNWWALV